MDKYTIKDVIDESNELIKDNVEQNERYVQTIEKAEKECLTKAAYIPAELQEAKRNVKRHKVLMDSYELLKAKVKPKIEIVKELFEEMEALELQEYRLYRLFEEFLTEYENWEKTSL